MITALRVIPIAGRDCMLLNLSGAHSAFFTGNILILTDNARCTGVGEVPGGVEQLVLRGHILWTIHRTEADHARLKPAAECKKIVYPKPDGKLTFDKLSSVFISNMNHEQNQPAHLKLKDTTVPEPASPSDHGACRQHRWCNRQCLTMYASEGRRVACIQSASG